MRSFVFRGLAAAFQSCVAYFVKLGTSHVRETGKDRQEQTGKSKERETGEDRQERQANERQEKTDKLNRRRGFFKFQRSCCLDWVFHSFVACKQ